MPGLDPSTPEEWRKSNEESDKSFDMVIAGAGMVLLSIIFGIVNFIIGGALKHKQEQREELLASDLQISRQGRSESLRLSDKLKGQPCRLETMLKAYRQYSMTKGKVWMGGFWARIPNITKRYIEGQYEQHPEWLDGAETGWWS
jgi:hypothetical protein